MLFDSELPADLSAVLDKWRNYAKHKEYEDPDELETTQNTDIFQ